MNSTLQDMIADIENEVIYTRSSIGKNRLISRVMKAMATVPRHKFVPPRLKYQAYVNHPLPIGHG